MVVCGRHEPFGLAQKHERGEGYGDDSLIAKTGTLSPGDQQAEGGVVRSLLKEGAQANRVVERVDPPLVLDFEGDPAHADREHEIDLWIRAALGLVGDVQSSDRGEGRTDDALG
jgi:hypothetical protein